MHDQPRSSIQEAPIAIANGAPDGARERPASVSLAEVVVDVLEEHRPAITNALTDDAAVQDSFEPTADVIEELEQEAA